VVHVCMSNKKYQYVFRKIGNGVDVQEHVLASPYDKPLLKRIWISLPNFVCWQIWLAINKSIFLNEEVRLCKIIGSLRAQIT
jgi:hypothetical protein